MHTTCVCIYEQEGEREFKKLVHVTVLLATLESCSVADRLWICSREDIAQILEAADWNHRQCS